MESKLSEWTLRKPTALLTIALTKHRLNSSRSYNLCIYTFPEAAGSSFGHIFCFPMVSAYESFDCSYQKIETTTSSTGKQMMNYKSN